MTAAEHRAYVDTVSLGGAAVVCEFSFASSVFGDCGPVQGPTLAIAGKLLVFSNNYVPILSVIFAAKATTTFAARAGRRVRMILSCMH